ncbi:peroxidase family protein [Candidatus Poriferisodalis sp.]|uniref:peroxidase family protein n=1 Tax=Candidatus Poriferisodalis sp. TaxID=3101277 RepID=UPI003B5B7A09
MSGPFERADPPRTRRSGRPQIAVCTALAVLASVLVTVGTAAPAAAAEEDDQTSPALSTAATSELWSASLSVGQSTGATGFAASSRLGAVSDDQITIGGTSHAVTELTVACSRPDTDCAVHFAVTPAIDGRTDRLVLRLRQVWLNLADARSDGEVLTWTGVRVRLRVGDIVPVALREYPMSFGVRSLDGWGNNVENPEFGSAGAQLLRLAAANYAGLSDVPTDMPGSRAVSNIVAAQARSITNAAQATDMVWQWGQFLDHDISLTPKHNPAESLPIPVPTGDAVFDPTSAGTRTIAFNRSAHGTAAGGTRQQLNVVTSFIDASNVYGSSLDRTQALRTNDGTVKLRTSGNGRFLPFNEFGLDNDSGGRGAGSSRTDLFAAGDIRANEQVRLSALHTLFVREHNRLADLIATAHPSLSGQEIFEMARKIVGAEMQVITYNEFLPILLGPDSVGSYDGYDPAVDASIANEFSTAAYRVGHTMLSPDLLMVDENGIERTLSLADAFFAPSRVTDEGISGLLRGLATQLAQQVDTQLVDPARNMLFGPPDSPGRDLAALNIQRSRDHGLASYNAARQAYGLPAATSFGDISSDPQVQAKLRQAYGEVGQIDLWTGGLAEDHVEEAMVGETFQTIIADQFRRLRDGDRFWYQNDTWFAANPDVLAEVDATTLADIIRRNTPIGDEIGDNVFINASRGYDIASVSESDSYEDTSSSEGHTAAEEIDEDDGPDEPTETQSGALNAQPSSSAQDRWPVPRFAHPNEPM